MHCSTKYKGLNLVFCCLSAPPTPLTAGVTDRQTDKQTNRQTDKQTNRQTDKQTNRKTDRQTDRQTHRQTDRQTDKGALDLRNTTYQKLYLRIFHVFNFCRTKMRLKLSEIGCLKLFTKLHFCPILVSKLQYALLFGTLVFLSAT